MFRSLLLIVISAVAFSSCSILPQGKPVTRYVLSQGKCALPSSTKGKGKLLLLKTNANSFIDSTRISYAQQSDTRSAYKLSAWVENPTTRFNSLLMQSLECSGQFESVTQRSISAPADYMLSTEITEFYHDLSQNPSQVRLAVRAELIDMYSKNILASNSFNFSTATSGKTAKAAVEKFDQGTQTILSALVEWTVKWTRQHASSPGSSESNSSE